MTAIDPKALRTLANGVTNHVSRDSEAGDRVAMGYAQPLARAVLALLDERERAAQGDAADRRTLDIVFDGPPGHESGRFVEVEDIAGNSIKAGEWIDRGNGMWALRITHAEHERLARYGYPGDGREPEADAIAASSRSSNDAEKTIAERDDVRSELARLQDWARAKLYAAGEPQHDQHVAEIARLTAEREQWRPVVEAALAWRKAKPVDDANSTGPWVGAYRALEEAIDALVKEQG